MPVGATWTRPAGGFFVWLRLPGWVDTKALLAAAVERRVAYVPGTAFYPDGRGADEMRLAFCYPPTERIREGVARLGALLSDRPAQAPDFTGAAVRHPEPVLKPEQHGKKNGGESPHAQRIVLSHLRQDNSLQATYQAIPR